MISPAELEVRLGTLLGAGSLLSTALLAAGLIAFLAAPGSAIAGWLLTAGLVTLMVTPAARVAVSMVTYAMDRDWAFTLMAATVLGVLAASVLFAVG